MIEYKCSFCGKPRSQVKVLIKSSAGSNHCICDKCLEDCKKQLDLVKEPENETQT